MHLESHKVGSDSAYPYLLSQSCPLNKQVGKCFFINFIIIFIVLPYSLSVSVKKFISKTLTT